MATTQSFQNAWEAYQQAVNELYAPPEAVKDADRGEGEIYREHLEERSEVLLTRSQELREMLVSSLEIENLEQRELATLKLLATAAYDLSVASDLMELEKAEPTTEVERGAHAQLLASEELMRVLDAPLEEGILALLDVERAVLPQNQQSARAKLQETIADFLEYVPQKASKTSKIAIEEGLFTLGWDSVQDAASVTIQAIMDHIPESVSGVVRRAANLIGEAIRKIQAAIGTKQEEFIRKQVSTWLKEIWKKTDVVANLLDKLYEVERLEDETRGIIEATPADTEYTSYNQATHTLEELLARYDKLLEVLNWIMRILKIVKKPLLGVTPWGPLAIYASYLGILGYAIYGGGDYLDWYRTGEHEWLDRVPGLRTTVRQSLETGT